MPTLQSALRLFALCLFSLTFVAVTQAQTAQRTFVSTSGSDANTAALCSAANPCRGFAAAQTVTTTGGEIIALTSGGYGPVEITKSLQITAPTGVYVAITAQTGTAIGGTDAIRVNNTSGGPVVLRGLTLNSLAVANGITFPAGGQLYVENCVINGFTDYGISVDRNTGGSPELYVTDTVIRNGNLDHPLDAGIFLRHAGGGVIRAVIDNSRLERAGWVGLLAADGARVTARNTLSARNNYGFIAATTGTGSHMTLERCAAAHNFFAGIHVGDFATFFGGAATARISNTASFESTAGAGVLVDTNGTAHISDSTINGNSGDGVHIADSSTSRAFLTFTTISGNVGKGLRRGASGQATSLGNNRLFDNGEANDAFSANITQQ